MRKLIAGAAIILLLVVTTVTVYYHFQHKIEIIYYPVNERVMIDDYEIIVKYISRTDFKNNWKGRPSWLMDQTWLIEKLPHDTFYWLARMDYFYSKPYEFNDDNYNYNIHLEVLNDSLSVEEEMSIDHIKIRLLDRETDNTYSANSKSYSRNGNATTMLATQEIEDRPSMVPKALSFESEDQGQIKNVEITQEPKSIKYNFFNRKEIIRNESADEVAGDFLYGLKYVEGEKTTSETDKKISDRFLEFQEPIYDLQYLGHHGQYDDVYVISVTEKDVDKPGLNLYMVYENLSWLIIEVENQRDGSSG